MIALLVRALSIFLVAFGLLNVLLGPVMATAGDATGASRVAFLVLGASWAATLGFPAIWFGVAMWGSVGKGTRREALAALPRAASGGETNPVSIPSRERIDEYLPLLVGCVLLGELAAFGIGLAFGGEFFLAGMLLAPALGLWWLPVRRWLRRIREGSFVLELDEAPVAIGERWTGRVRLSRPVGRGSLAPHRVRIDLRCLREVRKTIRSIVIERTVLYEAKRESTVPGDATELPVAFEIPETERETDASNGLDRVTWRLECSYEAGDRTREIGFDVPVCRRPSADPAH